MVRLLRQSQTARGRAATAERPVGYYGHRSIFSPVLFAPARSVDRPCGFRLGQPWALASSSPPSARLLQTYPPIATPAAAVGDSIEGKVADILVIVHGPDKAALQRGNPKTGGGRPQSDLHDTSTGCSKPWGLIAPSPSHLGRVQRRVRPADGCQLRAVPAANGDAGAAGAAMGPYRGNGQQGANILRFQGYVGRHGCLEGNRKTEMGGGGDQFALNREGGAIGRPRSFFFKPSFTTSEPYPDLRPRGMLLGAAGGDVVLAACPPAEPRPLSLGWRDTTGTLPAGREDSPPAVHRDRNGKLLIRRNPALARRHQMGRRSAPPGTPHTRAGRSLYIIGSSTTPRPLS